MNRRTQTRLVLQQLASTRLPSPFDIEYNMDEIDLEIFKFLKERHDWICEDDYEIVLDRLEKEHHYLQRIAATKIPENEEIADECNICADQETSNENFLVFCDGCNIGVHQACYGIPNIPEGNWLCRPCLQAPQKKINCILCPNPGGAFKKTSTGSWCHVLCGMLVAGARFENLSFLEPIDIDDVIRNIHTCQVCSLKKGGLSVCAYIGCRKGFHATCAVKEGFYIDASNCLTYCAEHDPTKKASQQPFLFGSPDTHYPVLEQSPVVRRVNVPLWVPKPRLLSVLDKVEPKILHYTVNRIAYRDLLGRPGATAFIKDMYPVWIYRRKGSSLIKRLRIDSLPSGFTNWGEFTPCLTLDCLTDSLSFIQKHNLPPEFHYPFKDIYLYHLLLIATERVNTALRTINQAVQITQASTRALEYSRSKLLSQHVQGYSQIQGVLSHLKQADTHQFFHEAVTDEIAPGYSAIISKPQCLHGITAKVKYLQYKSYQEVVQDLQLMINNAYRYNGRDSFIGKEAKRLQQILNQWQIQPGDFVLARLPPQPFLPYQVTPAQPNTPQDCLCLTPLHSRNLSLPPVQPPTNLTFTIPRSQVYPIRTPQPNLTGSIPTQLLAQINQLLTRLNQLTGLTPAQEKQQQASLRHLSTLYAYQARPQPHVHQANHNRTTQ
ncbi:hypothetical protein NEHOM01_1964 [Nematocida homosporus]|uniref:uncharacterized protein n=1 Tax=Nematocida homosporus TaxID=1912981 RepID=UPI00221E647A|nr:uncharacterized protein NEHOM01_1964 [Nematocida homosporus]KAI5187148.1 hypothetical protein NEHOM01_1964 [Nematocida homosporus]